MFEVDLRVMRAYHLALLVCGRHDGWLCARTRLLREIEGVEICGAGLGIEGGYRADLVEEMRYVFTAVCCAVPEAQRFTSSSSQARPQSAGDLPQAARMESAHISLSF